MASYTAQILVGRGHAGDNEGIIPDGTLFLSENSRPAWILQQSDRQIVWIPTVEHMLEDGLLMVVLYIVQHPDLVPLAQDYLHNQEENWAELYEDIASEHLQVLYQRNRSLHWEGKLIISIFKGSHLFSELPLLSEYSMNLELCVPCFTRLHSGWDGKLHINGSLEPTHNYR